MTGLILWPVRPGVFGNVQICVFSAFEQDSVRLRVLEVK